MPALVALNRKWNIATDDLPLPSLVGAAWHGFLLCAIALDLAFAVRQLDSSCHYRARHIAYLSVHIACFAANWLLHTWTFFESIRGSLFQTSKRSRVGALCVAVTVCYALTVGNNAYGTRLIYLLPRQPACISLPGTLHLKHTILLQFIVISNWVSLFIGCVAVFISLNIFSAYKTTSIWLRQLTAPCRTGGLSCICRTAPFRLCAARKGSNGVEDEDSQRAIAKNMSAMVVIANVFRHVFGGVDMTLTDYMATFALVGARHRHAKPACTYANAPPPEWLTPAGMHNGIQTATANGCVDGTDVILHLPNALNGNGVESAAVGTAAVLLRPPQIVEIAADAGRSTVVRGGVDVGGGCGSVGAAAAATEQGNGRCSTPRSPAALDGALAAQDGKAASHYVTANGNNNSHAAVLEGQPMHDAGAKRPAGSVLGPAVLSPATSRVFGQATLPDGRVPVLLDPRREWDGESTWKPNASLEVMEEAVHYMRFATAVYGWKMYVWMHRLQVSNCCLLCVGRDCGCCRQCVPTGPSEGCCSPAKLMDREAIMQLAGVREDDILYVSHKNKIGGLLPYYIAVDRTRRSLVVAVRGSLSLRDVVTDLLCEAAEYDIPGVPAMDEQGKRVLWAHRGILHSTKAILADIQQRGVLAAALAEWPADPEARSQLLQRLPSKKARGVALRLQGECAGWRLVITGHSLGAGVTGLLGPLLRAQFPDLLCWAFAPPGGLMSPKAAELTRQFCVGVVHAKDMISRLGVVTVEHLVQELVTAGAHCRMSKAAVMANLVLLSRQPDQPDLFTAFDELGADQKQALHDYSNLKASLEGSRYDNARDFMPPGHLLYIERGKLHVEPPCCSCNVCLLDKSSRGATYKCRWIHPSDLMERGLVVSKSMFLDHVPDNALRAMEQALEQMRREHGQGAITAGGYRPPAPVPAATAAAFAATAATTGDTPSPKLGASTPSSRVPQPDTQLLQEARVPNKGAQEEEEASARSQDVRLTVLPAEPGAHQDPTAAAAAVPLQTSMPSPGQDSARDSSSSSSSR